ncbi:MAG: TetR/AcrR family transcriptional regulator [Actinomycetota bacterium]|nr:TetR/AcrR family transcriptional regulator [Actinomycetota bacterium]
MPPASRPSRAERREDVTRRILEIGRRHLAEQGAAALSLRAVTRDLGMVSSAVYRYVGGRDELLTLLVVDAYTEMADAVDAAAGPGRGGFVGQVLTVAKAMRAWALAEPARYALLYGSPVPGYEAPGEVTSGPGTRVLLLLVRLLDEAAGSGVVPTGAGRVALPRTLVGDLTALCQQLGVRAVDEPTLARGVFLWTALVGTVSSEVFGHLGTDTYRRPEVAFEHQVRLAVATVTDP